jgi:hypothetical protein
MWERGDRVELVHTKDQFTKLTPGEKGTVLRAIDSDFTGYTVHIQWDCGSNLSMCLDIGDIIRKVDA